VSQSIQIPRELLERLRSYVASVANHEPQVRLRAIAQGDICSIDALLAGPVVDGDGEPSEELMAEVRLSFGAKQIFNGYSITERELKNAVRIVLRKRVGVGE